MNAVERLLAHGEQILNFYDEMNVERSGPNRDTFSLGDVPEESISSITDWLYREEFGRYPWKSWNWLRGAVEEAWMMGSWNSEGRAPAGTETRAAEIFRQMLAHREKLLHSHVLRRLLSDVVSSSQEWNPISAKVIDLAERVVEEAKEVWGQSDSTSPWQWQALQRDGLRFSLDRLHPYARPPAPVVEAAEKTAGSSSRRGGRPQSDETLARDLLAGWDAFKPEEGRPQKGDYIARRPEVMAMKSLDARQKKAALLLTALNSALALRRSKARQMRPPRG